MDHSSAPASQDNIQTLVHVVFDCSGIRPTELVLQLEPPPFLRRGHPTLAPDRHIVAGIDELRSLTDDCGGVVREVLTAAEALESVEDQVLLEGQVIQDSQVGDDGIAGETADPIGDHIRFDPQVPADVAQPGAGIDLIVDVGQIEFLLGVVVDGEGLGGEGLAADKALPSGHPSEGFCLIGLDLLIPHGTEDGVFVNDVSSPTWYKNAPGCNDLTIDPKLITLSSDLFRIESTAVFDDMAATVTAVVQRINDTETGSWHCRVLSRRMGAPVSNTQPTPP